jgi:hypothetical protein
MKRTMDLRLIRIARGRKSVNAHWNQWTKRLRKHTTNPGKTRHGLHAAAKASMPIGINGQSGSGSTPPTDWIDQGPYVAAKASMPFGIKWTKRLRKRTIDLTDLGSNKDRTWPQKRQCLLEPIDKAAQEAHHRPISAQGSYVAAPASLTIVANSQTRPVKHTMDQRLLRNCTRPHQQLIY